MIFSEQSIVSGGGGGSRGGGSAEPSVLRVLGRLFLLVKTPEAQF